MDFATKATLSASAARRPVPHAQRSPPTEELLRLIGSVDQSDAQLLDRGATILPPPAIYEYTNLGGLAALARLRMSRLRCWAGDSADLATSQSWWRICMPPP